MMWILICSLLRITIKMANLNYIPENFILSSAESVRKKVIDRVNEYEDLNGVDLSKTTFFAYMVDVLSMLSSDNTNALSLAKRESYLITAAQPSSVYNWASYLSYTTSLAHPCEVSALITIPLNFSSTVSFDIPQHTQFKANDVIYTNPDEYYHFVYDYATKSLTGDAIDVSNSGNSRKLNIKYDSNNAYFVVTLKQSIEIEETQFIPYDLAIYQPYSFTIAYKDKISDIRVFIRDNDVSDEEEWERADNYFNMGLSEKKYYFKYDSDNTIRIMFGNDIFGKQPERGATVRVVLTSTKAEQGAIIQGSLTKMDKLFYTDVNGVTKQISASVVNVLPSTEGIVAETLSDIRRNAIARFHARNRIVTATDYDELNQIIDEPLPYSYSKCVLKRSDIKANEMTLFVVIPSTTVDLYPQSTDSLQNDETKIVQTIPVPTDSIVAELPEGTDSFEPYSEFPYNDLTFVCPLGFIRESNTFGYYYYLLKSVSITPTGTMEDIYAYPITFPELSLSRLEDNSIAFMLEYEDITETVDVESLHATLTLQFTEKTKGPYECVIIPDNKVIFNNVPFVDIEEGKCAMQYIIYDNANHEIGTVKANYMIKQSLKRQVYSTVNKMDDGRFKVFDVPCIEKSFIDKMTSTEFENFERDIINRLMTNTALANYQMMNISSSIKFARTCGYSTNYDYNEATKAPVIAITNVPPADPQVGDRYIVGNEPEGEWTGRKGCIATYAETVGWYFLDCAPGDIIFVTSEDKKYTFSGNAQTWINQKIEIPFKVNVYVYVNSKLTSDTDASIGEKVKQQILYTLAASAGLQTDQHRSVLYQSIQGLGDYIDHCEIDIPEYDINYSFDIEDFTKEQLKLYVPEFIFTTYDSISVKVIRAS